MVSLSRYKPVGWRYESHKHALAARGIKTRYNATKVFPSEADEKGRILCPECNLPLNVKRPLVDKKCNCNRPWFAKKPMPTKDELAEQIHAEHPNIPFSEAKRLAALRHLVVLSEKENGRGDYFIRKSKKVNDAEYDKWVVAHNIEVKSIKPSARTKYAKPDKIDWVTLKKRLAKHKKKGESPYDAYVEEVQKQFKPIQSNTRMTLAQRKIARKKLAAERKEVAIREQLDSIIRVVSAVPGGGMRRKGSSEDVSKKKKKVNLDEDGNEIPKQSKAGKIGESAALPGSWSDYGDLPSGKEERVVRIKKNPKGTPGVRAEDADDEFDDFGVDSY